MKNLSRNFAAISSAALSLFAVGSADAVPLNPGSFASLGVLSATTGVVLINTDAAAPTLSVGGQVFRGVLVNQGAGLPTAAVFTFNSINLAAAVTFSGRGDRPLVLLSKGNAVIAGTIGAVWGSGNASSPAGYGIANGDLLVGLQGGSFGAATGTNAMWNGVGGGAVEIGAIGALSIGSIVGNGQAGSKLSSIVGGGGSGGGILLHGASVLATGLQASGGSGATYALGGGGAPRAGPNGAGGRILLAPEVYVLDSALPAVDVAGAPAISTTSGTIRVLQPQGTDGVFQVRPGQTVVGAGRVLSLSAAGTTALPDDGTLFVTNIGLRGGAVVAAQPYTSAGAIAIDSGTFLATSTATLKHTVRIASGGSFTAIGRADAVADLALDGGTFTALGGLSSTQQIAGRGSVIGRVSGSASSQLRAEGGTLTVGDANRNDAVPWMGSFAAVSRSGAPATLQLNSANQVVLGNTLLDGTDARLVTLNGARLTAGKAIDANASARVWGALHNDGTVRGPGSGTAFLTFDDLVTGPGSFQGQVRFAGGFSPGNSPGLVHAGSVEFDFTNTLRMELGGFLRGTDYDAIDATGTITLGGTLDVVLLSPDGSLFSPLAGANFDLLRASAIHGSFSATWLPQLVGGLQWHAGVLNDGGKEVYRLSVTAVPEPSQWLLMLAGGAWLLSRRRRTPA